MQILRFELDEKEQVQLLWLIGEIAEENVGKYLTLKQRKSQDTYTLSFGTLSKPQKVYAYFHFSGMLFTFARKHTKEPDD